MHSSTRVLATACALLMVFLAFNSVGVRASPPTSDNELNHSLASNGGSASSSGFSGVNGHANAIDGSTSTYWQSSTTTGWIAVAFSPRAYVNEVHIHFLSGSTIYPGLSLYLDTNANGAFETGEKLWSTTTNSVRDVVASVVVSFASGMKVTIDLTSGTNQPKIAELEAYLRSDSDGDGLTNNQETSTVYVQDSAAGGLPLNVPDDGTNVASSSASLAQFWGNPILGLANFTVDHARKTDLTAQIGYWDGSVWVDRYVWDPGRRLDKVSITQPASNAYVSGLVPVVASVLRPEITSKAEFRVSGVLSATVSTPVGSNFSWTWNTSGRPEGAVKLNVTQYDTIGGKAWSEITVNVDQPPQVPWGVPRAGSTVSDTVTIKVTATDPSGISSVAFYIDGLFLAKVLSPNAGTNGYSSGWGTSGYCSNIQHILKAIATEVAAPYLTSSQSVTVTASTFPLVCITTPVNGGVVKGIRTVTASPTAASGKTISKVSFYLDGSLQYTATASPWTWSWDTTLTTDDTHSLSVIATDSASKTASAAISVTVFNEIICTPRRCPTGPTGLSSVGTKTSAVSTSATSSASTVGILASEWKRGEVDVGTKATVVVDLVNAQSSASAAENVSRILRPSFPVSTFMSRLYWHLIIRDWTAPTAGQITAFTLRFEAKSDPLKADTDGDGILDGTEATFWGTLPVARDSDGDGLTDDYEIVPHSLTLTLNGVVTTLAPFTTSPINADTDGDGLSDGEERSLGVDRTITNPLSVDTDGDGLWDGFTIGTHLGELTYNANATLTDTDGDTFSDWTEVNPRSLILTINGASITRTVTTSPSSADTDGDGLKDNEEWYGTSVFGVKTDPSDPDTDHDNLVDGQERYMKEVAMPSRMSAGTSITVPLAVRIAGPVEKVTVSYGLSTIDVSNFYLSLSQGANSLVLRNHQGSGLVNFSSTNLPSSMFGGGTYTLSLSSWASGGILEKYSILFTIRTSPILADTDADGLNDSEETTYGRDGWITDPQLSDTDGDTWGDSFETVTKGTNPLSIDTDGDGVRDNLDIDPLHNLVVRVTVNRIHHGASPWCTPELVGIVRVNDAYTWVTQHLQATEDGYWSLGCFANIWSTASFQMSYYADVPDDVSTFTLRMTAWAINPGRGDDILVDQAQSYSLNTGIPSQTFSNGNSWYKFDVSTVALSKAKTILITDPQTTVTSAAGMIRTASQDRFFVFSLNVDSASSPLESGIDTILVPRSIFLDTKLKADFAAGLYAPLSNVPIYGDDLSKAAISDGVAAVIAGALTGSQANDVLNRLLMNASGGWSHSYVDITSQALVANLPYDVVKILPWQAVTNGPTGALPQDFWSKIGAVTSTVVNSLVYVGQLIYKGLVALGTFLTDLATAIVEWGMRSLGALWQAVTTVAQKIADAAVSLFNWVKDFVVGLFTTIINGFSALIQNAMSGLTTAVTGLFRNKGTLTSLLLGIPLVIGAVVKVRDIIENVFEVLEVAEAGITAVLAILSGGTAAVVKTLISHLTTEALLKAVVAATILQLIGTVVDTISESALNNTLGLVFKGAIGLIILRGAIWELYKDTKKITPQTKWPAVAASSLVGLLVELASGLFTEQIMNALGTNDPLVHGGLLAFFDELAFIVSFFGVVKLFKKVAGEDFLKTLRKVLTAVMSDVEDAITFVGFVGTEAGIASHVVTNEYGISI